MVVAMIDIKETLKNLAEENNLIDEEIEIKISDTRLDTSRIKDYPLMSGKEILLRANLRVVMEMPSQISQLNLKEL